MDFQLASDAYTMAQRRGQKEYKEYMAAGLDPHPAVLDEILENQPSDVVQDIGLLEIPAYRIKGTKSAGRISAFSPSFLPLLGANTEFATKWCALCDAHLSNVGIREPIVCFEYLGNFYVQEGNKRVSVLRYFEAPRIPAYVRRVVPPLTEEPRIKAYYEFMEFYKTAKLYNLQFRRPGDYAKLLAHLGKDPEEIWTEQERRTFSAYYSYFLDAFHTVNKEKSMVVSDSIIPEEALLLWLQIHPYRELGEMSSGALKRSLTALWPDVVAGSRETEMTVDTEPVEETRGNLLSWIISPNPEHVNVAFVHQMNPSSSGWVQGHETGRRYLEAALGEQVTVRSYYDANTPEQAMALLEQAVADGAQVVFTTAPRLSRETLKMAVAEPKVHFLNCSVDQPYSSVRTYYGRIYEAKFITGAIAGAMAQDDRIGYIGSNPIFGVPASINAFALGAQMTNPRAQVELRWSCVEGNPQADFFREGIRVVSNRDVPTQDRMYMEFCNYGTYQLDDRGGLVPLASPVWVWGKFYKYVVQAILTGNWKEKQTHKVVNYWLGMDSGVIDISLSRKLPAGVRELAELLRQSLANKTLDPFARRIVTQDGTVKNDGKAVFTPEQLLRMDWLCENVVGSIPTFDEILPMSRTLVRELGVYRDQLPAIKEVSP